MFRNSLKKKIIWFTILLTLCLFINFTAFAAEIPDAGKISSSIKDSKLNSTDKNSANIDVSQSPEVSIDPSEPKIKVERIIISGQDLYSQEQLSTLIEEYFGQEITFGELEAIAGRIAKYFQSQGYLVANAFIPAQNIKDGVVEITVLVGRYSGVTIHNQARISTDKINGLVSSIKKRDYIKQDTLERTILLLNDTSGIRAKAILTPGKEHGTTDLIIDVKDTAQFTGSITGDNHGNRFAGQTRGGIDLVFHNLSGIGDEAGLGGLYAGKGMNDYHFSYLLPVGGHGLKIGASYSRLHYSLGEDFASLNASGIAKAASIYLTYPITRTRDANLNFRIGYDSKKFQDIVTSILSDSLKSNNVWSIGLSGDKQDAHYSGITSFGLTLTRGRISMESPDAVDNDTMAKTAGDYSKINFSISRVKYLNDRLSYGLAFNGQLANKNLASAEKIPLGGPTGVRAYPTGEASGDEACLFIGELRWNLPTPNFQLAAFYDAGKATLNKNPWQGSGVNNRSLVGAGIGLIFSRTNDYSIRIDYAWKITSDPATTDTDKNGRFWVKGVKYF